MEVSAQDLHRSHAVTDDSSAKMAVVERRVGDIVVLDVMGRMTVEAGTHDLSTCVQRCLKAGHRGMVVNLRDVPYCDTGGIGALVTSLTAAGVEGGVVFLAEVQPYVRGLLDETGLSPVFRFFRDESAAVDAVRQYLV